MIDQLHAGGIHRHLLIKNYPQSHPRNLVDPRTSYSANRPLTIRQYYVLGLTLTVGNALSIIVFLCELIPSMFKH